MPEDKDSTLKSIIQSVKLRNSTHSGQLTEDQILAVSFKEYVFSLEEGQLSSKLK